MVNLLVQFICAKPAKIQRGEVIGWPIFRGIGVGGERIPKVEVSLSPSLLAQQERTQIRAVTNSLPDSQMKFSSSA